MSNGEERKVSLQDIQLVQNLIERCLQLYMNKREVVNTLYHQAKIEPSFTELVWQKLEAENQDFFRAYHIRLVVKDQIVRFNQLLEKQAELMNQMSQSEASLTPLSNGSHTQSLHRNPAYRDPQPHISSIKSENMYPVASVVPNGYTNGNYSLQQSMQVAGNMPSHGGRLEFPTHMPMLQNSNAGIMQGFNGRTIKSESVYAGNSPVMFGPDNNHAEAHNNVLSETSISPFNGGESCSHSFNESMLETEMNSFGVEQMTRNFSLSDLTADYSNSTDILESYSRSPFLGTDTNFLDPHVRGEDQDFRRLENIPEGFNYEGFGTN